KFSLSVLGLLVVGCAHWPWTGRLAAQAREDSPLAARQRMVEDQDQGAWHQGRTSASRDVEGTARAVRAKRSGAASGLHAGRSGRLLGRIGNGERLSSAA